MTISDEVAHRYVIVGAGPGGLQLSYFLQRAGADYLTLEREATPGCFFRSYPRHRRLISLNKVHTRSDDPEIRLRWDWNSLLSDSAEPLFPRYTDDYFPSADVMLEYLADFQRQHALNVRFTSGVDHIEKVAGEFHVRAGDLLVRAECLIMATGWGGPFVPPIDGIELAAGYEDMQITPAAYADQRVLIIGKGNSAFETAYRLFDHAAMVHLASPRPLRLAWNTKHPGDVRGQYGALLDSYQFKTLHSVLDCDIERIWREGDVYKVLITYTHADGEQELLEYDSVLRCTGFRVNTAPFGDSCRPELVRNGKLPAVREDWQSTNVDGLYFAGTLMQARDFKRASSAFIDGFRYNLRTLSRLLRERYDKAPLEYDVLAADPDVLTEAALDRLNRSSALWTQFEYLCDVFVVDPDDDRRVRHYQDLPEDYAVARFGDLPHYYTANLRWGRDDYRDVFAIERHPVPERAAESAFIHPVIRRYRHREVAAERHLLEDLLAVWRRPERHVKPLNEFFRGQLAAP
ncbi:MAG TPA: NAD(P)-binding domain-containing protein [Streptosporangiaceae bacterium]|nr:NAD(P)-binding domain-containing protein [Streptosporangiaceae bacterium]